MSWAYKGRRLTFPSQLCSNEGTPRRILRNLENQVELAWRDVSQLDQYLHQRRIYSHSLKCCSPRMLQYKFRSRPRPLRLKLTTTAGNRSMNSVFRHISLFAQNCAHPCWWSSLVTQTLENDTQCWTLFIESVWLKQYRHLKTALSNHKFCINDFVSTMTIVNISQKHRLCMGIQMLLYYWRHGRKFQNDKY